MSGEPYRKQVGPEESRANVRALHVSQLESAGGARAQALREAEEHLDRIARLIPDAVDSGLSLTDVARITGVSRPTLYQLRARYGKSYAHLRLAVLQAVSDGDGALPAMARKLGRPKGDLWPVAWDLVDVGALDAEPLENEEPPQPEFRLTPKGHDLMAWLFEMEDEAEREGR